ncbi:MAG: MarR family winged helix-turn-helix transcriptional regulator [Streptosporangiaceae bacterium]
MSREAEARSGLIASLLAEVRGLSTALDQLDQAAADRLGINRTDMRCLDLLEQRGEPMTAGQLAQSAGLTTGAVTTLIDRLERVGYARRLQDTADRRKVLVEPTDSLREQTRHIFSGLGARVRTLADGYSNSQLAVIREFTQALQAAIALHADTLG